MDFIPKNLSLILKLDVYSQDFVYVCCVVWRKFFLFHPPCPSGCLCCQPYQILAVSIVQFVNSLHQRDVLYISILKYGQLLIVFRRKVQHQHACLFIFIPFFENLFQAGSCIFCQFDGWIGGKRQFYGYSVAVLWQVFPEIVRCDENLNGVATRFLFSQFLQFRSINSLITKLMKWLTAIIYPKTVKQ